MHCPFALHHEPIVDLAWRLVNDLVLGVQRTVAPEDHAYGELGCFWYGHEVLHTVLFTVKYCFALLSTPQFPIVRGANSSRIAVNALITSS